MYPARWVPQVQVSCEETNLNVWHYFFLQRWWKSHEIAHSNPNKSHEITLCQLLLLLLHHHHHHPNKWLLLWLLFLLLLTAPKPKSARRGTEWNPIFDANRPAASPVVLYLEWLHHFIPMEPTMNCIILMNKFTIKSHSMPLYKPY